MWARSRWSRPISAIPASIARALDGADGCINLVGVLYESGRQGFSGLHAQGVEEIAAACAARGIARMVQVSAIGADLTSISKYARTKAEGEAAVRRLLPQAAIVRPSVVFGVDDDFFNRFAAMASISPILPLPGGGGTRFQPVFVGDVATAVVAALREPSAAGKTFEIGGPDVYTYRRLMELMLAEIHKTRILAPLPWGLAKLIGLVGDLQAKLLPFAPPLTSDQVELLKHDNVASPSLPGLKALGVSAPVAVEAIIPTYLYRYRRGGQFAVDPAPSGA